MDIVLRFDLETLARDFSEEDRLALYNDVSSAYKRYLQECSGSLSRDDDIEHRGRFLLAKLLLAASFQVNGENHPEITGRFREEEYKLLMDFEEMKIFDYLDINDIVEFIERKEGKVYEIVKKYYERQYYLFDTKWAKLMGPMAKVFSDRYRERRKKIEDAVIEYIRKRSLTLFVSEMEDAIRKVLESREEKKKVDTLLEEVKKLREAIEVRLEIRLASIEEAIRRGQVLGGEQVKSLEKLHQETAEEIQRLTAELEKARRRLREKEEELRHFARQYSEKEAAHEILMAEAESLRARVGELEKALKEYRAMSEQLEMEKSRLEARLEEMLRAARGEAEGNLVTSEEAWALEESLVQRVLLVTGEEATVYDPLRGGTRRVRWSSRMYYSLQPGSRPSGKGVMLVAERGVLRRRRDVVLEAVTLVHGEAYSEKGFDSRPVGLGELLDYLGPRLREAEEAGFYRIIVVSSPTGFTEKARGYVEGGPGFSLASRYVTLYLVDPVRGELYYRRGDAAAEANRGLAEPWLSEEQVMKVVEYLLSDEAKDKALVNSAARPYLTGSEVARATGRDVSIVRKAFQVLEEKGIGRVVMVDGKAAFVYEKIG